jgi:hypothetical protein
MSNNGLMTYKNKWLSFINKGIITLLLGVLLIVIVPCSYLLFTYWSEMPIFIKIFWPILLAIIFIGVIIIPLNGMIITKKGTILFLPDFRLKKFNVKDLEKIAIVFTEWDNNKYSVMIKFIYRDGKVFNKDYSKQFRNMKNKKLAMSMYTITKRKIERICNKLLDLNICVTTIIDKNRNITYQSK